MPIKDINALVGLADTIMEEVEPTHIPSSLYHYTTAEGLLGIIGSDTLRFSDAPYLNDGSEIFYGFGLFVECLTQLMKNKSDEEKTFAAAVQAEVARNAEAFRMAVFCTSEAPNLLNQWRDYGPGKVAYQLELEPFGMLERGKSANFAISLFRMIYNEGNQRSIMDRTLRTLRDRCLALREAGEVDDLEASANLTAMTAMQIVWLMYRLKNPAFRAEQEWRFVARTVHDIPSSAMDFRVGQLGVVPFYTWRKNTDDGPLLPIKSVMVGPSPDARVSDLALKEFLKAKGHTVPTLYSTIPLRR